jgi:hypothetical protein
MHDHPRLPCHCMCTRLLLTPLHLPPQADCSDMCEVLVLLNQLVLRYKEALAELLEQALPLAVQRVHALLSPDWDWAGQWDRANGPATPGVLRCRRLLLQCLCKCWAPAYHMCGCLHPWAVRSLPVVLNYSSTCMMMHACTPCLACQAVCCCCRTRSLSSCNSPHPQSPRAQVLLAWHLTSIVPLPLCTQPQARH